MATASANYFLPPMPEGLEGLTELALNLRWSWSHTADPLWEYIDPDTWNLTGNPWLILQTVSRTRLEALRSDTRFRELMDKYVAGHRESLQTIRWFQQSYPLSPVTVAYFSMEYGLGEALPIYSGGLGILAGDYLKTASDLGVAAIGIGLLYQQGYLRQTLNADGSQREVFPYNDPTQLPIVPVRDQAGEWLHVEVEFPGRMVRLRIWEATVGQVKLYLLDSNDLTNSPVDRGITSELYGGGPELRLQQEIALGIGGWRVLYKLGIQPEICHLNEGHASLAILERARNLMASTGYSFDVALTATRSANVFTTHTPVEAGFDRFPPDMIGRYLASYANELGIGLDGLFALGRKNPANQDEPLNMAYLAIRGSGTVNAVSRLHGEVSRSIFQPLFPRIPQHEVPVTHVTNGVHVPSWDSALADTLWTDFCGDARWQGTLELIEQNLKEVSEENLWTFRMESVKELIRYVRERLSRQLASVGAPGRDIRQCKELLDHKSLTMGFARRFTGYKRPNLLLHDPERLVRLLTNPERPVQLIIAGTAHPQDIEGKEMIRAWSRFIRRPEVRPHVVFLADYDIILAQKLVHGVDLWINTPRRPWEACGTSGMKVLVNGGLNLSEVDGWWAEAYRPEVGWALGDGHEHRDDPHWDAYEAEELYRLLESEIVPCFYDRNEKGIPLQWVTRMRASMSELTPAFSSNRMVREYVESIYLPAIEATAKRQANDGQMAKQISQWRKSVETLWPQLSMRNFIFENTGADSYVFRVDVELGAVNPGTVEVQLYADPRHDEPPLYYRMTRAEGARPFTNTYRYEAEIRTNRPPSDFTPRLIPALGGAMVPLEAPQVLWYR
ncbi:MAG TPA: alpha-glucan family phosphorylase [Syntrophales bacterium]|nr:alpha-glucan family phosphorylase [Syntrophales bacterium]